jgi:2-aminoadipate transaminase
MASPEKFSLSRRAARTTAQPIGELMAMGVEREDLISLAAGLVDFSTLPSEDLASIAVDLLQGVNRDARVPLQYGTTEGLAELRGKLLSHIASLDGLKTEDYGATAEDIVISSGSQQLLFLLTDVLVDEGDIVITAWPSYFVYTGALKGFGAEVRCVEMDSSGMKPESLEGLLETLKAEGRLDRVKIVYVQPDHQNPTGLSLAADRREPIARLVERFSINHRILLIEDAAYRELTYDGSVALSIKRFDRDNQFVALLQTFSKTFSPGLRTGYGLIPRDLVNPVLFQKGGHDFGSSNLSQHLILEAMARGAYTRQVRKLRAHYRAKAEAIQKALAHELGPCDEVTWTQPTGGLYVWLSLPPSIDTGQAGPLWPKALDAGVSYVPGAYCYAADPDRPLPNHQMRLSFGTAEIDQIGEAIKRLAFVVRPLLGHL